MCLASANIFFLFLQWIKSTVHTCLQQCYRIETLQKWYEDFGLWKELSLPICYNLCQRPSNQKKNVTLIICWVNSVISVRIYISLPSYILTHVLKQILSDRQRFSIGCSVLKNIVKDVEKVERLRTKEIAWKDEVNKMQENIVVNKHKKANKRLKR